MTVVTSTGKLEAGLAEFCICSSDTVFFRLIVENDSSRLMTVASSKNGSRHRACPRQGFLMTVARAIFRERSYPFEEQRDHAGRPYVEARLPFTATGAKNVATAILRPLGVNDIQILAPAEMLKLEGSPAPEYRKTVQAKSARPLPAASQLGNTPHPSQEQGSSSSSRKEIASCKSTILLIVQILLFFGTILLVGAFAPWLLTAFIVVATIISVLLGKEGRVGAYGRYDGGE